MRKRVTLAIAVTAAMCLGFFGSAAQAQEYTLKIQASWPSGLMAYENLEMFAETVEKVSAGRLKIEHLPAGAIVGAFEVLDATSRGVIDGGHTAAAYWVGKHFAAGLLCCPPGGPFGMDHHDFLGWMYEGGGLELYQELYQDVLNMQVVAFPILPIGPQALGWFKDVIRSWDDFKGMKYRIPRRRRGCFQGRRRQRRHPAGGRNPAGRRARRHRRGGVGRGPSKTCVWASTTYGKSTTRRACTNPPRWASC